MGHSAVLPLLRTRTVQYLPLPWDATSFERRGAAKGARVLARLVADGASPGPVLPPVEGGFTHPNDHDRFAQEAKARALGAGLPYVGLGGDHSVTFPLVEAAIRERPGEWGLVVLDAHADVQPELPANRHSSGSVVRRIVEAGFVDPSLIAICGVRAATAKQEAYAAEAGIRLLGTSALAESPMTAGREVARQMEACDAVYVSVDLDVLNPNLYPGVTVPAPGGVNLPETAAFLAALTGLPVAAGDVTEYRPESDPEQETLYAAGEITALLAQLCTLD